MILKKEYRFDFSDGVLTGSGYTYTPNVITCSIKSGNKFGFEHHYNKKTGWALAIEPGLSAFEVEQYIDGTATVVKEYDDSTTKTEMVELSPYCKISSLVSLFI